MRRSTGYRGTRRRSPRRRPTKLSPEVLQILNDAFGGAVPDVSPTPAAPTYGPPTPAPRPNTAPFAIPQARPTFDEDYGVELHGLGLTDDTMHRTAALGENAGKVEKTMRRGEELRQIREDPGLLNPLLTALALNPILGPETLIAKAGGSLAGKAGASAAIKGLFRGAEEGADAAGALRASQGASTGARVIRGTGRAVAKTGRGGYKVASYPLRHPGQTLAAPAIAEIPAAIAHGDPSQIGKAFEGTGVAASILGGVGSGVQKAVPGVAGNALSDLISLPAQVLPSSYMLGAAGVEAAQGDSSRASKLWKDYKKTDFLPALLSGDPGEALSRVGEHPLYSALEVAGLAHAGGRAAGAAARKGALGDSAAQVAARDARPQVNVYGNIGIDRGNYSPDIIRAFAQRRADARAKGKRGTQGGAIQATERQAGRHLRSATDRFMFGAEQVRRGGIREESHAADEIAKAAGDSADSISHAVQRIATNPERYASDLQQYRETLLAQRENLAPSQLAANTQMVKSIDKALESGDPRRIFEASQSFIERQGPIQQELVDRGLLAPDQAAKAAAIPYARVHMGADHGLSNRSKHIEQQILTDMKQKGLSPAERGRLLGRLTSVRAKRETVGPDGEALSLEDIQSHMDESGVAAPGFLTQRPNAQGAANFFKAFRERPSMGGKRRSGQATTEGTFDSSFEALRQQLIGSRSILESAKNFDAFTKRFGLKGHDPDNPQAGRYFENTSEARAAIDHPEDFGMTLPDVPGGWVPWRISPWPNAIRATEAAKKYGEPESRAEGGKPELDEHLLETDDPNLAENVTRNAIAKAQEAGDGPVVLMPKIVAKRMEQHFSEKLPIEKTAEALTGAFKGAVLPTSPSWFAGNILDTWGVRTLTAGLTPKEIRAGKSFADVVKNELGPDDASRALESLVPGGLYSNYNRIQPYRAAEQFLGTKVGPLWRAAGTLRRTPGPKQVADLYARYRDAMFEWNGKYVETLPQYGQLARTARKDLNMTRRQFTKAIADGEPAVRDLAKGLRNQDTQIRYAKSVESVFGNWGKNGPEARRFLTTWAPFWQWARAATKFAFVTLPRDHPILTALIAAGEQMTREERQKLGFDFAAELKLPPFLQGGIPGPGGSTIKTSNLTTFGFFADPVSNYAKVPFSQVAGPLDAALGIEWTGDKMTNADGSPADDATKAKAAFMAAGESFIPFLNVVRSTVTKGPKGILPTKTYDKGVVEFLREQSSLPSFTVTEGADSSDSSSGSTSFGSDYFKSITPSGGGSFDADYFSKLGG